ncbi:inositol 1,4,5-trisphosphate receptor-interacting protein-like 1 [Heliangelus exortis]|uniref:inositol 1,4,5-trisphosphate receptor-interacting protein-like 1 n=1 Tax=Heliangelus exortis TaxID=472823 RepID=UPI003A93A64D
MGAIEFLASVVLSLIHRPQMVGDGLDEETLVRMQQREEMLRWHMTRLLKEVEELQKKPPGECSLQLRTREQSPWEALLFAVLQHWRFSALGAVLFVLFSLWWWRKKRTSRPYATRKAGSSIAMAGQEEGEETARLLSDLPGFFPMAEELVDDVLSICRKLSRNSFMPRMGTAFRTGTESENWAPREADAVHCFMVPIEPPHGHSFHIELGTEEETQVQIYRLRVELECTCPEEQVVEELLCQLHHPDEELRNPSLRDTLCRGPYLNFEELTNRFQVLVAAACVLLSEWRHCGILVQPYMRSCRLQVTTPTGGSLLIEMMLGVQQGDSDSFFRIK